MNISLDSESLRTRVNSLGLRAAQLVGRKTADQEKQEQLTKKVADAKGRAALGPQVASVFEGMQHLAHQRSVGTLEQLLSAILKDVLPTEGAVRLVPSYKANTTHLDILLEKNGSLEDVLDGNGGAVTNVVCAGLRFAALSRTKNRRLMVLDEPDCWLSLDRVTSFSKTLAQVSAKGKFQTAMISHKHSSYHEGHSNIVRFTEDANGKVQAIAMSPLVSDWESDEQPGIRSIELINVRRHEHTFVPFFPGATVYLGSSNLGKSTALMTSFKAVAYGESDDSLIRHGCEEAKIIIRFENNQRLEWSRHIKRSPAVLYRHYRGDELIAEGRPKTRNSAPEWVEELLGVSRVDDLDIQVGNQKMPVFLLNDSAPRRAQILSVGRESSYLPGLMRRYEQMKAADRELVKQGEAELARLKLKLTYLQRVPKLAESQQALAAQAEQILRALESREKLSAALARLESKLETVSRLSQTLDVLNKLPAVPELADGAPLARTIARLERTSRVQSIGELPSVPEVPQLHDLSRITELGKKIARLQKLDALAESFKSPLPELPSMKETQSILERIEKLGRRQKAVTEGEQAVAAASKELAASTAALNKMIDELGGACPLCGNGLAHEHEEESHAH